MKLSPLGDRIIVKPDDIKIEKDAISDKIDVTRQDDGSTTTSSGLIVIPDTVAEAHESKALTGTVVDVGFALDWKTWLQPGTRVLFGQYAGARLDKSVVGYEDHLLMAEGDVLAVMEEN